MTKKVSVYNWLAVMFKEFLVEMANKPRYEIVNIYECQKTGFKKAVIKLSERHTIEKNISDIVTDPDLIEGLDKKTIRTITYMATVEYLKPDYAIVIQHMTNEVDDYLLEIKSKNKDETIRKSPVELSKDESLISRFNPVDANRIGYLAGVRETVKENQMFLNKVK